MKRKSSFVFTIFLGISSLFPILGSAAEDSPNPVISGYYTQWSIYERDYHASDIPGHLLTHLLYAFAVPVYYERSDRAILAPGDEYADLQKPYPGDTENQAYKGNFNQLLLLRAKYPHLKILISVGGWGGSDHFSDIAASEQARWTFADSCVEFIQKYQFDGLDIDWEFPVFGGREQMIHRPEDAENFILLMQELRSRLDAAGLKDGRSYILTMAGNGAYNSLATRYHDLGTIAGLVDWVHVMAFGYSGVWSALSGHLEPLFKNPDAANPPMNVDNTIQTYIDLGIPPSQIVLGMLFTGFGLKGVSNVNNGLFQPHDGAFEEGTWDVPGIFDFGDLVDGTEGHDYVNANGFTRHWDPVSRAAYLFHPTDGIFISYEDESSVEAKSDYVIANQLRGMMYFPMDADTDDCRLQTTIKRKLYPSELEYAATQSSQQRQLTISWFAWEGQRYKISFTTDIREAEWEPADWLIDEEGVSMINPITGANTEISLIDPEATQHSTGYYRIELIQDDTWP